MTGMDQPPLVLRAEDAIRKVRELASDSANIVIVGHARERGKSRRINRIMIERCLQRGTLVEGPYVAPRSGFWRMNFYRHAAGEEMTCVVEIDWPARLLVVTVF
jgi:hypothetical protein